MAYSRRSRFGDGKSNLSRVEFARAFDTRVRPARAGHDAPPGTTSPQPGGRAGTPAGAAGRPAGPSAPGL